MPELPEIEIIARFFADKVIGERVCDVIVNRSDLRIRIPDSFRDVVKGCEIFDVHRVAKYLVMSLGPEEKLVFHLGMSGRVLYTSKYHPEKHDHVVLVLHNGYRIIFNDPRRFGMVAVVDRDGYETLLQNVGPDPFSDQFNADYISSINGRLRIKAALMRGDIVAGIGNIYASEILFRARVLPDREVRTLYPVECKNIVEATRATLELAVTTGGSTIRDYRSPTGMHGDFPKHFRVYNRAECCCYECGNYVRKSRQGGRSTFFCVQCQK